MTHTLGLIRLWRIPKGSFTPRRKYGSMSRRVYKDSDTPYIPQCQQSELGLKKFGPGESKPVPLVLLLGLYGFSVSASHPPGPPRMMWWCRECAVQCPSRFLMTRSSYPGAQVAASCITNPEPLDFDRSVHSSMWSRLWPVARLALLLTLDWVLSLALAASAC